MENRLINEVTKLCTSFVLQDFRCPKLHSVSTRVMTATSDLCVNLEMDQPPVKIKETLSILLRVAKFHKFSWLEQSINDIMTSPLF